jgi:hypothetical protein
MTMAKERLNLSGEGTASDLEIQLASDNILAILKDFKNPKDAGSALTLAHFEMLKACFPPAFRKEAMDALEGHTQLIKDFLDEGWQ